MVQVARSASSRVSLFEWISTNVPAMQSALASTESSHHAGAYSCLLSLALLFVGLVFVFLLSFCLAFCLWPLSFVFSTTVLKVMAKLSKLTRREQPELHPYSVSGCRQGSGVSIRCSPMHLHRGSSVEWQRANGNHMPEQGFIRAGGLSCCRACHITYLTLS